MSTKARCYSKVGMLCPTHTYTTPEDTCAFIVPIKTETLELLTAPENRTALKLVLQDIVQRIADLILNKE